MVYKCAKCDKLVKRDRVTHNPVCFDCKQERRRLASKSNRKIKEKNKMIQETEVEKEAEVSEEAEKATEEKSE